MPVKVALFVMVLVAAGFFVRYGSARPCDWLMHDWSVKTGLPVIAVDALVRIRLRSTRPTAGQCLKGWVQLHFKGIEGIG